MTEGRVSSAGMTSDEYPGPLLRCHLHDCREPALYVARLDWTNQPAVYLCMEHAGEERKWDSVYSIAGLMLDKETGR